MNIHGTYTLDDFPLDPHAPYHDVARLNLRPDGTFLMLGKLNGEDVSSSGAWDLLEDRLTLTGADDRSFRLDWKNMTPERLWMGTHIQHEELDGGFPRRTYHITVHRPPAEAAYQGPLTHEEHGMVGHHTLDSDRFGHCTVHLDADRRGAIEGTVDGRPVRWEGAWMSAVPMTYLKVDGTDTTIAIHKEHGDHAHYAGDGQEIDLIVNDADKLGEYNMTMRHGHH